MLGFAVWTHITAGKGVFPNLPEIAAVLAVFAAAWLVYEHGEGWAFAATTVAMATTVHVALRRPISPASWCRAPTSAYDLTMSNTAAGSYALKVMTVVVVIFLPFVLAYQAWTYYVFRRRISQDDFAPGRRVPRRLRHQPGLPGRPAGADVITSPNAGPAQKKAEAAMTDRVDALVIFGATGDLAKLETFPALVGLVERGVLDVPVIGVAKSGWGLEQFRDYAAASLKLNGMDPAAPAAAKMLGLLRYVDGDLDDDATYAAMSEPDGHRRSGPVLPGGAAAAVRADREGDLGGGPGAAARG